MSEEFINTITKGLCEIGLQPERDILDKFALYYSELKTWSKAYNITALKHDRDIAIKLFLDSLLYLKVFPEFFDETKALRVLDVGSGGGFPGVVLKIVQPELDITLLEPSWKRVSFLRHITNKLKLKDVSVIQSTIEEYAKKIGIHPNPNPLCSPRSKGGIRGKSREEKSNNIIDSSEKGAGRGGNEQLQKNKIYNIILTRALFRICEFIKKTEKIVTKGSILILSKGPGFIEELREVQSKLGSKTSQYNIETITVKLPLTDIIRYFVRITVKANIG